MLEKTENKRKRIPNNAFKCFKIINHRDPSVIGRFHFWQSHLSSSAVWLAVNKKQIILPAFHLLFLMHPLFFTSSMELFR